MKETTSNDNQRRVKTWKTCWQKLKEGLCGHRKIAKSEQKVTGVESNNTLTPPKCPLITGEVCIEFVEKETIGNNCNNGFSYEDQGIDVCVSEDISVESISVAADNDIRDEDQSSETDPDIDIQSTDRSKYEYFSDDSIPLVLGIEEESNEQMVGIIDDFMDDISLEWDDSSAGLELIGDFNRENSLDGLMVEMREIDVKQDINVEDELHHHIEDRQPVDAPPDRRLLNVMPPEFGSNLTLLDYGVVYFFWVTIIWLVFLQRYPILGF